ncbi:hypothetical protein QBC46DRAFT_405599 [Diplogelasinospora grovesii]|uniref:Aminoglycoside phosphotransferase domain-containing protein n=1 Tax=Diplogelasinospora grovesii TaxID=303347 RepID=A0AAN6NDP5_9PEZI|nr:hypothetical protein QBC46DRAFT_405599 [Diplogelasinospora grovesii]
MDTDRGALVSCPYQKKRPTAFTHGLFLSPKYKGPQIRKTISPQTLFANSLTLQEVRDLIKYKYGLQKEAQMQKYAFEALQQTPDEHRRGFCIPEIYRVMVDEEGSAYTYIIMEYVCGKTLGALMDDDLHKELGLLTEPENSHLGVPFSRSYYEDKLEKAFKLLLSFPVPETVTAPGRWDGGHIKHPLFREFDAPIRYESIEMLEKHINAVAAHRVRDQDSALTVKLERKLHFVCSDLYEGNFMFTDAGDLYIIDFEQANFLPLSFMSFAVDTRMRAVCYMLYGKLDLPQENLPAMRKAQYWFSIAGWQLGRS